MDNFNYKIKIKTNF